MQKNWIKIYHFSSSCHLKTDIFANNYFIYITLSSLHYVRLLVGGTWKKTTCYELWKNESPICFKPLFLFTRYGLKWRAKQIFIMRRGCCSLLVRRLLFCTTTLKNLVTIFIKEQTLIYNSAHKHNSIL